MWGPIQFVVPRLALLASLLITSAQAQTSTLSDLDALRYIASHGDLVQLYGSDPAKGRAHYQEYGAKEGRTITFDPLSYVATHPDLIEIIGVNEEKATRHYINFGFQEKRATTGFNALAYIASYLDLMDTFGVDSVKATRHYIEFGFKEGRRITFNALSYIASHSDLIAAFGIDEVTGTRHFIQFGFKEGRRVSFDPSAYLSLHSDLQSAFGKDLVAATKHYIQFGFKEGRATVGQPIIQLSPSSIDFGSVQQGSSSPIRTILVANVGTAPLTISRISVGGASGNEFSQTNNCSSIGAGGSCTISVTFKPTSTGSKSASISLVHNASGSPANVSFSGVASPTLASSVLVDIDSIKNATTDKSGITFKSGSSAIRMFLVAGSYNIQPVGPASEGKYVALEFCTCNVSPRKYSWVYDYRTSSNASPKRIASLGGPIGNGQDYYDANQALRDAPTERITLSQDGWIEFFLYDTVIDDNFGGVSLKVMPSGIGSSPASISDLDALRYIASHTDLIAAFGADAAKGRSHYETSGIKEGRKITFEPLNYTASHPDLIALFGIDETRAVTNYIQSGFKEGRKVTFDPAVYLALHADLRAAFGADRAAAARHYIQFGFKEGRATGPVILLSSSAISFGSVVQGNTSSIRSVVISNAGNSPLIISQVSLSGPNSNQFTQENNCATVPAGGSCTISTAFKPTTTGDKIATISISHNATGSPSTLSLSGSGASTPAPMISVNPTRLIVSQTTNTTSSAQTVTVSNAGNATLTVSGVSLTGADAGQFAQTNNCSSVAAGSSCTISVTFRPTPAFGSRSAHVSISHNASGSPAFVSLSGTLSGPESVSGSLTVDCVGANCSAVNSNTYRGSGVGVWAYVNDSSVPALVDISLTGVTSSNKITLLFSNGGKSGAPSTPNFGTLSNISASSEVPLRGYRAEASFSETVASSRDSTHMEVLAENRRLLAALRAKRSTRLDADGESSSFGSLPSLSSATLGSTRIWKEFEQGSPDRGVVLASHTTSVRSVCDARSGRKIIFWVDDELWASGKMTSGLLEKFQIAYCGQPNTSAAGGYARLVSLYGETWGAHRFNNLISDSPMLQDLNIVMVSSAYTAVAGYFSASNNFIDQASSNKALVFFIDISKFTGDRTSTFRVNDSISTLIHETMHMMNFYQRGIKQQQDHDLWLEETSAMMSEDIVTPKITGGYHPMSGRVSDYLATGGGVSYIDFRSRAESYAIGGAFGAFMNRRYGLGFFKSLQACEGSSYDCVDSFANLNGGGTFSKEFARMGASVFSMLPSAGLPAQYGFPARTDGEYVFNAMNIQEWGDIRPSSGTRIGVYLLTTQTFIEDSVPIGIQNYSRKSVVVPARTSLTVIVK